MTKQAKKNVQYSIATHAVEKMKPSKEAVRLSGQIAEGRITADSAVKQIMRCYGVKVEKQT